MLQLRQQHVPNAQPVSHTSRQQKDVAIFLERLNTLHITNPESNMGFVSTKGELLDDSLLELPQLSKDSMFDFFKHQGAGKSSNVFIYAQDREFQRNIQKDTLHKEVGQKLQEMKAKDPQQSKSLQ